MYCPRCDMDFVDGITVCSDCGGKLITHEEYEKQLQEAAAKVAEEKRPEEEQRRQAAEDMINASLARSGEAGGQNAGDRGEENGSGHDEDYTDFTSEDPQIRQERDSILRSTLDEPSVYVSKASAYEDNKSSAGAFFSVGGILTVAMILVYAGVFSLPAAFNSILTKVMLTVIGVGFIAIGFVSMKKASVLKEQAAEEDKLNEELINWFIENYTAEDIDAQAKTSTGEEAGEEELALARLSYIQDEILANYDIGDRTYADSLAEEIYAKIYEH